jgi:hypothetical protein
VNGIIEIQGAYSSSPAITVTAANNGLSKSNGTTVVLGQDSGAVGDPAQLLNGREIPVGGNPIELRQGVFGTGGFSIIGAAHDGSVGGLFHCFTGSSVSEPSGTIIFRATQLEPNAIGAIMQLECPGDALSSVIQVGAFGSNAGLPVFRRGTGGIISNNVLQPDVLLEASAIGGGGGRPGRILFATNNAGTETLTYSFLLPVLANLDFPNTLAQTSSDLNVNIPGAALSDLALVAPPNGSVNANSCFTAWVSAVDTVTIRFNNYSAAAINPAAGNFKISVIKLL